MNKRRRVYAYVTSEKGVLILEHPRHPEAGLQVPGGTVEKNETPEQAVIREVFEETALKDVSIVTLLGFDEFDMSAYQMDEIQQAWFFHLQCNEQTELSWFHEEAFAQEGPIPFRLYWSPLPYQGRELIAHHGRYLEKLGS